MSDDRKIRFGYGYDYNHKIPPFENWKNMKEFYLKDRGLDIGDFPVMTETEVKEIAEKLANIK